MNADLSLSLKTELDDFTGYRSVPLKNGFSENLELASLLVYVDTQQVEVRNFFNKIFTRY